ncbi:hypothetical protein [Brachybacterium saurashtrense]|uniref:DUF4352 domain-containing protein n=1 Tax=Brachybacterium saurashtrense TaxID=556288 RepID=A0A345YQD0_9MICO|nr:hypothetical protein [Brachybacterium saurashtrense]AXK46132.1 hypothetical protein DWV08_11290 [Brachybacterium saurashtrense]RRR23872.1 hypothetical protein DXU92_03040 [Brachybacterium saurashtrense]
MSRTIIARGAALAAVTVLALTACGGADEAPAEESQEAGVAEAAEGAAEEEPADDSSASDAEDTEAEEGEAEPEAAAADEGAVVEIGTEFTDEETGDVVTVVSAVRNMPTEYYLASDNPDGEMIYLEIAVTPGDTFGGVVSQQDFFLDDGGEEVNYASSADEEVTAAGYTYFEGAPRRDGEATGYIPIYVEQSGDTLTGAYVRPEAKILGEDETIPEFRGEFEIPAA